MDRATRDRLITDLGRKVADDVSACLDRTSSLMPDASAHFAIALSAAAVAIGRATGFSQVMGRELGMTCTPEELVDGIWDLLRPMALKSAGGSDADFRALLAKVGAVSSPRRKAALVGEGR